MFCKSGADAPGGTIIPIKPPSNGSLISYHPRCGEKLSYDSGNRPLTLNPLWVKFSPTPAVTHTHTGLANLVQQTHTPFCFIDGLDELTLF